MEMQLKDSEGTIYRINEYIPSTNILRHNSSELSQVKNLIKDCEKNTGRLAEVHKSQLKEHIRLYIEEELDKLFLAKHPSGKLAGMAGYKIVHHEGNRIFAQDGIYVHPSFRNKGLGQGLDNMIQEIEMSLGGFQGVHMSMIAGDAATASFFEKRGYEYIKKGMYFRPNK